MDPAFSDVHLVCLHLSCHLGSQRPAHGQHVSSYKELHRGGMPEAALPASDASLPVSFWVDSHPHCGLWPSWESECCVEPTEAPGRHWRPKSSGILSTLAGAAGTCGLSVKFQSPCWSGPSSLSSRRVVSLSLEDIQSLFPFQTTQLIYLPGRQVTSWRDWKGFPPAIFLKVLCFLFMEWLLLLLNLSNTSHSQKPPNVHASDGWGRFSVFHFIQYSQLCGYCGLTGNDLYWDSSFSRMGLAAAVQ